MRAAARSATARASSSRPDTWSGRPPAALTAASSESARKRLRIWDISDEQVKAFLSTGKVNTKLTISSPLHGHVIKKFQREGNYVDEGAPLYDVADLDTVWIEAQVYEEDQAFLFAGYKPNENQPLIFHMHGHYSNLESMVLTEDDYLDFLINLTENRNLLPPMLQGYLTNPKPPDLAGMGVFAGSALFALLLAMLRARYVWFPFHPMGYALGMGGTVDRWWFALVLCSAIKSVVVRYGGVRGFQKTAPFFMGLVLGNYVVACLWSLLALWRNEPMYWGWQG